MHLLIACAGSGRRMGAERNKLLLEVSGRPVLAWTLDAALASSRAPETSSCGARCMREGEHIAKGSGKPRVVTEKALVCVACVVRSACVWLVLVSVCVRLRLLRRRRRPAKFGKVTRAVARGL